MSQTETWTIGRLLTWTTDYLKQHGADSARLDAEVLLATALQCERIELYTRYEEEANDEVRTAFRELVRRRAVGEPVAYLVGRKEFYSLPFYVNSHVLIPRPETEFLVIAVLDWAKEQGLTDNPLQIADVGTGSGCISVCLARNLPNAAIKAIDISPNAIQVAGKNIANHDVGSRVTLVEGDLLQSIEPDPAFDIVVSNPPYVSDDEFSRLDDDVRSYEPKTALVAGPAGTEVIQRLVAQSAERLRPGGALFLEISPMIAVDVKEIIDADPRWQPAVISNDLAQMPRVVKTELRA